MGKEGGPIQYDLPGFGSKRETEDGEVSFRAGTTLFFDSSGRGDLRTDIRAKKIPHKVKGYNGYIALDRLDLLYKGLGPTRYWSLPSGTRFGTWSKFAHSPKK